MKNTSNCPATLLCDFYKISHREQYPTGTQCVYSTWIPRTSRLDGVNKVVAFGFQAFIKEYLIDYFNENFFERPLDEVVNEYERVIKYTLNVDKVDSSHIVALHKLGFLPIIIRAVKEGTLVPLRVPMLTIENTREEFFWITNYLETLMSCELWAPATSATISNQYHNILMRYARLTNGDTSGVTYQGHDFSMRGMSSVKSAQASGAGHLLSFTGTDSIPAILYAEKYYNADIEKECVGTSISATEHSVMCAYGRDEFESYKRIITEVYPHGFVSIVSDTWDLWKVLTDVIAKLKPEIMARNGKVVIRPDSGDPVNIICGDPDGETELERKGVVEVLWDIFGGTMTEKNFKQLDSHIGCIYGDAITLKRCEEICDRLAKKGFASTNMVFGIGSYTYQYNTRDTFGFALKSTHVVINGQEINIYKDPATDKDKIKKSLTGRVIVLKTPTGLVARDGLNMADEAHFGKENMLKKIFVNGKLRREDSLASIRDTLQQENT